MNIWSKHILEHRGLDYNDRFSPVCKVEFKDGTSLSVQASEFHNCDPQENNPRGGWSSFEVWCVKDMTYADLVDLYGVDETGVLDAKTEDPAGWVSSSKLDRIAERHGGIAS